MPALKCNGTKTIQSRILPILAERVMKYIWKKNRKYSNKSELIFETTGTSNSSIILESMNSESVSLSCPHILCYKKKRFSGLFLCTLNVSMLKRSLHQSLFKMPKFFLWAPRMYFVRSPVSAMVSLYFSCHHIDFFVDFFVDFELTQIHWHRQKKISCAVCSEYMLQQCYCHKRLWRGSCVNEQNISHRKELQKVQAN